MGFYDILPYYFEAGQGKGRMWQRSKGKVYGIRQGLHAATLEATLEP